MILVELKDFGVIGPIDFFERVEYFAKEKGKNLKGEEV
jgi:hypothetical protein